MMQLTEHLDRFKTGEMGHISLRIANAPGQPAIDSVAPEYRAGMGDLILLQQELIRMKNSRRPWDKWEQRAFRVLGFIFCLVGCLVGLGVFFASDTEVSPALMILYSAWMGLALATVIVFVVVSTRPRSDTFVLDYQINKITELLNIGTIQWNDINGR